MERHHDGGSTRRALVAGIAATVVSSRIIAQAQQAPRVIGFLSAATEATAKIARDSFQEGLRQTGLVVGANLQIEDRLANGHYERLGGLAADLVARGVALIAALGSPNAALAAQAATGTIPIIFATGGDPVALGLVKSINRPGTNATGVSFRFTAMVGKRMGILHELIPTAAVVAFLMNPTTTTSESEAKGATEAAKRLGLRLVTLRAASEDDLTAAFASAAAQQVAAMQIASDPVLDVTLGDAIVSRATRAGIPILANTESISKAGGLASYGPDLATGFRMAGISAGRILNGTKPSDLPVEQVDTFRLVINLKAAKALGVIIPTTLLATADEVIE